MTARTTPAPRGRPRDPRRDAAIYDAVVELLAEVGFDRMSLDAVGARAGVSKPTIYRRCPDGKAALVAAAIAFHREAKPPTPDTGSLREDLLAMVRDMSEHMAENAHLAGGLMSQLRSSPELREIFAEHVIEPSRDGWRLVLERAAERGEIAPGATELFPDVGPSLIHGRVSFGSEPLDDAFAVELVDRVLLPILRHDNPKDPR
jgi:AcrR family transcriptional regulator